MSSKIHCRFCDAIVPEPHRCPNNTADPESAKAAKRQNARIEERKEELQREAENPQVPSLTDELVAEPVAYHSAKKVKRSKSE